MKIKRVLMMGLQIRSVHQYSFRSGDWATVVGIVNVEPEGCSARLCWHVGFDDGEYDHWPMHEHYEFREPA